MDPPCHHWLAWRELTLLKLFLQGSRHATPRGSFDVTNRLRSNLQTSLQLSLHRIAATREGGHHRHQPAGVFAYAPKLNLVGSY